MKLVAADTSPLRYLVEIGSEYLLPHIFTQILIPGAVASEVRQERTPRMVRNWAEHFPSWIEISKIASFPSGHKPLGLHRGEWEAIQLAKEVTATLLLIDDRFGVRIARSQGFTVTGTLGVLVEAAQLNLVSIEQALEQLALTHFRGTSLLYAQTRALVRAARKEDHCPSDVV